jgi:large subunit ribosomal protein L21
MYAVIETGGKQYRVEVGTELQVELLDVEPGQSITLERVLLVADGGESTVGTPVVADAAVEAEVVGAMRGEKVIAFKYRPKARRRVMKGHRQNLTILRIADIRFNGKSAAEADAKARDARKTERQRVEEAAARQAAEDAALAARLNVGATTAEPKAPTRRAKAEAAPAADATEAPKRRATKPAEAAPVEAEAASATDTSTTETTTPAEGDGPGAAVNTDTEAAPRKRTRAKKDE